MRLIDFLKKINILELFFIFIFIYPLIVMSNVGASKLLNSDKEYRASYHKNMEKGYLTIEETTKMLKEDKIHFSDDEARVGEMVSYFLMITLSMLFLSLFLFLTKYFHLIKIRLLVLIPLIFVTSTLANAGIGQSVLWVFFGSFGVLVAGYLQKVDHS